MAGIADVQPKSIGQVNITPVSPAVLPGPAGSGVSETLPQAFEAYSNMFNRIKDKPLIDIQRQNAMQQAQIAQQNAPAVGQAQQAAAQLATAQAEQQKSTLNTGDLIKKHYQYYGATIPGADGKPDYDAMAHSGLAASQAEARLAYAQAGLQRQPPVTYFENGVQHTRFLNALGDDITPNPDGSPSKTLQRYQQMRTDAFEQLHSPPDYPSNLPASFAPKPDTEAGDAAPPQFHAPDSAAPVIPAPVVMPLTPPASPGEARAALVNAGALSGNAAAQISDADVTPAWESYAAHVAQLPVVQPAAAQPVTVSTPSHTVTVAPRTAAPAAAPSVSSISPDGSLVTGYAPGFSPPEIVKSLRESEIYKNWAEKSAVMGRFRAAAGSYTGAPGEITTQKDIALANAALQLQAPGGGGSGGRGAPELRVNSLEEAQPLLEQAYGIKAKILKTRKFEEGTRNRLIELGKQSIQALEDPARGAVQTAAAQLQRSQAFPEQHLFPYELGLLKGGPAAPSAGAASYGPPVKTLDGRTVRMKLPVAGGQ
jgi:hypothetical protein